MASGVVSLGTQSDFSFQLVWKSSHQGGNNCYVSVEIQAKTNDLMAHTLDSIGCTFYLYDRNNSSIYSHHMNVGSSTIGSSWKILYVGGYTTEYDSYGIAKGYVSGGIGATYTYENNLYINKNGKSGLLTFGSINKYAVITSAPNFSDVDNPTIKYSNSWDAKDVQAAISIDGTTDDIAYRPVSGGEYTFELNDDERQVLINSITEGGSRTVKFMLKSTIGSSTSKKPKDVVFSLIDYEPTLNPVVIDMNSTTYALTGDYNKFIKGYSRAACQTHAVARKNATITEYYFEHNGITRKEKTDLASFIEVEVPLFVLGATDSRGNTARQEINVDIIDYFKPWCEVSAEYTLQNETTMDIQLNISGTAWNQNFGAIKNKFKLEWRITDADGRWTDWQDVSEDARFVFDSKKPNEFTYYTNITDARYDKSYSFQARITDELDSHTSEIYKRKLLPVFDWGEEDFNFNVPVKMNNQTVLRHNLTANNTVLSASGGFIYFRPAGTNSTSNEMRITPQGNLEITGDIIVDGVNITEALRNAGII